LIPLQRRAHPIWKYVGSGDLTRSIGTKWDKKEYTVALKRITMAQFSSLEEGLSPFTPDEIAVPTISHVLLEVLSLLLNLILMSFVFPQTFNILQGTLPPIDDDLPEEYQEASEATDREPNEADSDDDEEEVQSSGDGGRWTPLS
jgi:hypothetical protein